MLQPAGPTPRGCDLQRRPLQGQFCSCLWLYWAMAGGSGWGQKVTWGQGDGGDTAQAAESGQRRLGEGRGGSLREPSSRPCSVRPGREGGVSCPHSGHRRHRLPSCPYAEPPTPTSHHKAAGCGGLSTPARQALPAPLGQGPAVKSPP